MVEDVLLAPFQFLTVLEPLVPDLVSIPSNLVPELVVGPQDLLIVPAQEEGREIARGLLVWDPFDLVALGGIADRVPVWPSAPGATGSVVWTFDRCSRVPL